MSKIHSYSSIFALGHRAITDLLQGPVVVQEKIDGSQISFKQEKGSVWIRSKGADIDYDTEQRTSVKMFQPAVTTILDLHKRGLLRDGVTYRGEFVNNHNVLKYSSLPPGHIILFDMDEGDQVYVTPETLFLEGQRLGLMTVPTLFVGKLEEFEQVKGFLAQESVLGGVKPEGVVIKNYGLFGVDKKVVMGKYVTEAFKEDHSDKWKTERQPKRGDVVAELAERFTTEARWRKGVQHLREAGQLTDSPQDIGPLMKEVVADVQRDSEAAIKEMLFKEFWPQIRKRLTTGLPEWYKAELAQSQFDKAGVYEVVDAVAATDGL